MRKIFGCVLIAVALPAQAFGMEQFVSQTRGRINGDWVTPVLIVENGQYKFQMYPPDVGFEPDYTCTIDSWPLRSPVIELGCSDGISRVAIQENTDQIIFSGIRMDRVIEHD